MNAMNTNSHYKSCGQLTMEQLLFFEMKIRDRLNLETSVF